MAGLEARVILQNHEAIEVCEVFHEWEGRGAELPESLRRELREITTSPEAMFEVEQVGPGVYETAAKPRVRALVANLRARARDAAYQGLKR